MDQIVLTRRTSGYQFDGATSQHVWPITVTAVSSFADLSSKIFVYHAGAGLAVGDADAFSCVASLSQMGELPEDAPQPGIPFYRRNSLEMRLRSPELLEDFWTQLQEHVQDLIDNLKAVRQQDETLEVTLS